MSEGKKPFHNPFEKLGALKDSLPAGPTRVERTKEKAPPPRAVVRMERAGRNGKEVTVIEQLELSAEAREAWLKELKASLGCGGTIEGTSLVLQGDHRERCARWLSKKGVRRVSVG